MKIETFPNFLCTIENDGILTTVAIPWDNCEYVPAIVHEAATAQNFPFPVKLLKHPYRWHLARSKVAVRTDLYPLLWVYVWLHLQIDNQIDKAFSIFMWHCNRLGIAKTEPGSVPSIRDFKINGSNILSIISWVLALVVAINWFASDYPYLGFSWMSLWGWVQFRMWQDRRNREQIIKDLESYLRGAEQNWTAENTFVPDLAGNLIPIFPETTLGLADCQGCKYFYGKQNVVCAVHPFGYDSEFCGDRCSG